MSDLQKLAKQYAEEDLASGAIEQHEVERCAKSWLKWLYEQKEDRFRIHHHDGDGNNGGRYE